jgi:hypothetical protein
VRRARLVWEMLAGVVRRDPLRVELAEILWDKDRLRLSGSSGADMDAVCDLALRYGCSPSRVRIGGQAVDTVVVHGPVGSLVKFGREFAERLGYEES